MHNAPPQGYYALFGILSCWVTVVVPFVFSYVRLDEEDMPMCEKVASAAKATVGFAVSLVAVFLVGLAMRPGHSKWSKRPDQHWIKMVLDTDHAGSAAILFTMGCLACAGTVLWLIFTAYGLAALPMALLKGKKALGAARQMGVGDAGAVRWTEKGAAEALWVCCWVAWCGVVWPALYLIRIAVLCSDGIAFTGACLLVLYAPPYLGNRPSDTFRSISFTHFTLAPPRLPTGDEVMDVEQRLVRVRHELKAVQGKRFLRKKDKDKIIQLEQQVHLTYSASPR